VRLGFRVDDQNAIYTYHANIMADRARAEKGPLKTGQTYTLNLDIPPQNSDPRSRRVPFIPTDRGCGVSLQLVEALQPGVNMYSQVWTANVVTAPRTRLILKIIQPSMIRCPHPEDRWIGDYTHPCNLAGEEAWAYRNLLDRQGLSIPYFFGMHTITTPSGESAWVLVLEFIPGRTVNEV
ncbi:hypothetical protein B0H13DRAFT_1524680, partial [Mycena leptocephala]